MNVYLYLHSHNDALRLLFDLFLLGSLLKLSLFQHLLRCLNWLQFKCYFISPASLCEENLLSKHEIFVLFFCIRCTWLTVWFCSTKRLTVFVMHTLQCLNVLFIRIDSMLIDKILIDFSLLASFDLNWISFTVNVIRPFGLLLLRYVNHYMITTWCLKCRYLSGHLIKWSRVEIYTFGGNSTRFPISTHVYISIVLGSNVLTENLLVILPRILN